MKAKQPNILFFFPDQHRPDWLGSNSQLPLKTPNLDKLCARGTRFINAMTPSPVCAPARACLASGMDYKNCRVPSNQENYPKELPTYYQRLQDAGYHVCGVGKFDLHKDLATPRSELDWHLDGSRCLQEWGFDEGIDNEGKFDGSASFKAAGRPKGPYMNLLHNKGLAEQYAREHTERGKFRNAYVTSLSDEDYCDNWISGNGLNFLKNFPQNKPWHLVVNFTGPHNPMDVTQGMHDKWKGVQFPSPVDNRQENYSQEDHQRNRRHYAAMIENIDRQVGRFIECVRHRGELDNTLIIYASDHGEMLGDNNRWGKSIWYQPSVGIPLIAAGPGVSQGVKTDALVSLHDLTATFLDFSSAQPLPNMKSRSLQPILEGKTHEHRDYLFSALADWQIVFDGRFKLILQEEKNPVLFDLKEDPHELSDIAAEMPEKVAELTEIMKNEAS